MNHTHIESVDVEDLEPREKNPNVMAPEQFDMLVIAIKQVGFLQPLLVRYPDEEPISGRDGRGATRYEIIDGVHRWRAAKAAGLKTLPCVVVDDASEADAITLQIGMNRMRGELDLAGVAESLGTLQGMGWGPIDMTLTGFSLPEVNDLLATLVDAGSEFKPGEVGGDEPGDDAPGPETFLLEIPFVDRKQMTKARRKLKKLGNGDMALGLVLALSEE